MTKQVNEHFDNGIWKITSVEPPSYRIGRHGVFINSIRVNAPLVMMYINHERGKVDEIYGKCLKTSYIEKIVVDGNYFGDIENIKIQTENSLYTLERVF